MTVNGRPRWTCRTHVSQGGLRAAASRSARWRTCPSSRIWLPTCGRSSRSGSRRKGAFAPSRTRDDAVERDQAGRRKRDIAPMPPSNASIVASAMRPATPCVGIEAYLGPAALNRAWSLVNDQRDAGNRARLQAVAASGGCHACHSHQSCQEHCPQALNPTASIAGLKRLTMARLPQGRDNERPPVCLAAVTAALMVPLVVRACRGHLLRHPQGPERRRHSVAHARQHLLGVVLRCLCRGGSHSRRDRVRTVLTEWSPLDERVAGICAVAFGVLLLGSACGRWRRWCCREDTRGAWSIAGASVAGGAGAQAFRAWRWRFSCRCIFLTLGLAIDGEARLERFLRWSDQPS